MLDKLAVISSNMIKTQENEYSLLHKTNESVNWLSKNIERHGPAWFGMSEGAKQIKKDVKLLKRLIEQRKLSEWK